MWAMYLFQPFSKVHFSLRRLLFLLLAKDSVVPLLRPKAKLLISLCLPVGGSLCAPVSRSPKLISPSHSPFSVKESTARLKQGLANCDPGAKSSLTPVFVNDILLEHSQAHSFVCLWLPPQYSGATKSPEVDRDHTACKARRTFWSFTEKVCQSLD